MADIMEAFEVLEQTAPLAETPPVQKGGRLPLGTHDGTILDAECGVGEYGPQVAWRLRIDGGEYDGVTGMKWSNLDSEKGRGHLVDDCESLDIPLHTWATLAGDLQPAVGMRARFDVFNEAKRYVSFLERLSDGGAPPDVPPRSKLTSAAIDKMSDEEIEVESRKLNIDPDEYAEYDEVRAVMKEKLDL